MAPKSIKVKIKRLSDTVEVLRPPLPHRKPKEYSGSGEFVVLLHGLWRSEAAMAPLARRLSQQGFHVLNIPYPSFRLDAEQIIEQLEERILKSAQGRPVNFVTHSLGGVLARYLLERESFRAFSRMVMLAPPNQGSAIVRMLEETPLIRLLGPMGRALHPERLLNSLPNECPDQTDALVVAGTKSKIPFFRKQLDEINDGIVSLAETRLPGTESCLIKVDHTMITAHPSVLENTGAFLMGEAWPERG